MGNQSVVYDETTSLFDIEQFKESTLLPTIEIQKFGVTIEYAPTIEKARQKYKGRDYVFFSHDGNGRKVRVS